MLYSSDWGNVPGLQTAAETYENAFRWGPAGLGLITGGTINASAVDSGNSPTSTLRPGLLLGQITADGTWSDYDPTATDGSQVATGVLLTGLRMENLLTGVNQNKFYGILVGGPVKTAALLNYDLMARAQMSEHFMFDDQLGFAGAHWFPYKNFVSKTSNYVVTAYDNYTLFDNAGASGAVTFTLPAIDNGYFFGFKVVANQTVTVTSAEGDNIVAFNDAAATSLAFSTSGQKIGGGLRVYSNLLGTLWHAENASAGTNTITVA